MFGSVAALGQGSGLDNLRTRLHEVGGSLTAGPRGGGWFRLEVVAPVFAS